MGLTGDERWIWVSLRYPRIATFALAVRDGRIVEAPPIARWTIGKTEEKVAGFYRAEGAVFVPLNDP